MNTEMRRALAREPFEEKIRKIAKLLQLSAKVKIKAAEEPFNGAALSESVLAREWNSPEEDSARENL